MQSHGDHVLESKKELLSDVECSCLLLFSSVCAGPARAFPAQVRLTALAVLAQLSAVHVQLSAAEPNATPQFLVDLCAFIDLQARVLADSLVRGVGTWMMCVGKVFPVHVSSWQYFCFSHEVWS